MAEALQAIHTCEVVHRDLKPSNVLLPAEGPRVIDFGIARAVDATPLTGTGIRIGTPRSWPPSRCSGTAAPPSTCSRWAVWRVRGDRPHAVRRGPRPGGALPRGADEPQLDGCPPELRDLIARCLAKDPAHRPTPRALVAGSELERYAQPEPGPEWLPPPLTHALPAYAAPPSPPPARTRRTFGLGVVAGAAVAAAVVAAAITAVLIKPGAADGAPLAQPAATVTVTQQAPASTPPSDTGKARPPPGTGDTTPIPGGTATEGSVAGAKAGTLLGTYKGIDVTQYYGVNFTDDPTHPKENEGDVEYGSIGLRADKMAVLDSGQNGTYQACVDNTKYMSSYEADQAKGRLVCIFGQSTIGLVKVTKVSEGDSDYITMDLTVWQR